MKRLGIAHRSVSDIQNGHASLYESQERCSILVPRKIDGIFFSKSPKCVFSPLCSTVLVPPTNLKLHHKMKDNGMNTS